MSIALTYLSQLSVCTCMYSRSVHYWLCVCVCVSNSVHVCVCTIWWKLYSAWTLIGGFSVEGIILYIFHHICLLCQTFLHPAVTNWLLIRPGLWSLSAFCLFTIVHLRISRTSTSLSGDFEWERDYLLKDFFYFMAKTQPEVNLFC